MRGKLDKKVVVVAGGGGIGDQLARHYAEEGASVVLGDLNGEAARAVAKDIDSSGKRALGEQGVKMALKGTAIKSRLGVPSDIAAVGTLLLSDDGSFISGQIISVDGGATMRT